VGHPAAPTVLTLDRNFLHAAAIEFQQPRTGAPLKFEAPLPKELVEFLEEVRG
jgi:23S rRNA-/tRNA-specific pseudouridylate synthase